MRADRVAITKLPFEEPQRERVLEQPLDRALQRSRAVRRIPAGLRDQLAGAVGELQRDARSASRSRESGME